MAVERPGRRLVSVVVPLLNEQPTLAELFREVTEALSELPVDWEIVFVDDGSTDGSYRELVRLHEENTNVRVVRLRRNFGKAAALAAGIEAAEGEVVVTMDADLQDDPAEIPQLLAKLDEGYDLVSGWKCDRQRSVRPALRLADLQRRHAARHRREAARHELRAQGVPRGGVRERAALRRTPPIRAGARAPSRLQGHGDPRQPPAAVERPARASGSSATCAALRPAHDRVHGRYRYRPLHLFGGIGLLLGIAGFVILALPDGRSRSAAPGSASAAADARRAARRRRDAVLLARADRRDADEPARGEGAARRASGRTHVRDVLR